MPSICVKNVFPIDSMWGASATQYREPTHRKAAAAHGTHTWVSSHHLNLVADFPAHHQLSSLSLSPPEQCKEDLKFLAVIEKTKGL